MRHIQSEFYEITIFHSNINYAIYLKNYTKYNQIK